MIDWTKVDWEEYNLRVEMYVATGMDRSDAEAVVDAEMMSEEQ